MCEKIPADEIEITPEMVEAGAVAYLRGNPDFDSIEEIATTIYREMVAARIQTTGPATAQGR